MSNKIDLKNYFEKNLNELKEFQFLKEFYNHNLNKIIRKDEETLDKLRDKLLQIIIVFEGDYKISEKVLNFLLEIIQAFIDNTKIKIGYIILLNPILEYLINVIRIQTKERDEEKMKLFDKEKENLLFNLDSILEKNFMKVKYAPYLIELVEIYNEDNNNKEEQINNFWLHSFIKGNQDILDKISKFYSVEKIDLLNIKEHLEKIKEKRNSNS